MLVVILEVHSIEHPEYILVQLRFRTAVCERWVGFIQKVVEDIEQKHHVLVEGGRVELELQLKHYGLLELGEF